MRGAATLLLIVAQALGSERPARREVLAFYYGWYGNPEVSGKWVHWKDVDLANHTIGGSTHFPALGAYDSHDPNVIAQHVKQACEAGEGCGDHRVHHDEAGSRRFSRL